MVDYWQHYRQLRTDWLKLKGHLFDTETQLPALPAVVDDVRRRLEGGEGVGLIYLDPSSGGHLESRCGWQTYDQLIQEMARTLRDYRRDQLGEQDTLALAGGVRSDEFVLFVGLDDGERLDDLRGAIVERIEGALSALDGDLHQVPRLDSAAIPLELRPTVRIERSIYHSLQKVRELCRRESERRAPGCLAELRRMLRDGDILIRYQPIVKLSSGGIHGFEALSSAPSREVFENSEMLFSFAEQSESIVDLERLCRRQATRRAAELLRPDGVGAGGKLFLNCSAHAFNDTRLLADLAQGARAAGCDPSDLVVEVTERVAITEWQSFQRSLAELRREGLRIAIDDMGSGYSSLHAVAQIEPDYLKFDLSLIHDVHRSTIKRDLLETLVVLSEKIGARSVAEGIEVPEEFATVRDMGVHYGQGYLFASPSPPADVEGVHFPDQV